MENTIENYMDNSVHTGVILWFKWVRVSKGHPYSSKWDLQGP